MSLEYVEHKIAEALKLSGGNEIESFADELNGLS